MAGLRKESHIVLTLLVCGVIIYLLSPDVHWGKKKEKQQTHSRKSDILLSQNNQNSQPMKQPQTAELDKPTLSQSVKSSSPINQPSTDNSFVNTDFSVTEYVQKLNKIKGAKNLLVMADSHGSGLERVIKKYLPGWKIQVAFFRGYTIEQVQREVTDMLSSLHPRNHSFVILHAGTNDFFQVLRPKPVHPLPGQYKERHSDSYIINSAQTALKTLTEQFPKASIIYSANLPRADIPEYPPRKEYVNKEIKTKMADIPRTHFVDHSPLFHDKSGQADKRLLVDDLLHMNTAGRDLIIRNLIRTMANISKL